MKKFMIVTIQIIMLLAVMEFSRSENQPVCPIIIPREASRMIAESNIEKCSICRNKLRKDAFSAINPVLSPGSLIKTGDSYTFVKNDNCGADEFMLTCATDREMIKDKDGKEIGLSPIAVFRFHSEKNRMIGISKEEYSGKKDRGVFHSIKKNSEFHGEIVIIKYAYGDGPSYNFNARENKIIVHCRIINIAGK
jgi:hypothetical protein